MSVSRRSESAMLRTTTDLSTEAISAVMGALNPLLADARLSQLYFGHAGAGGGEGAHA